MESPATETELFAFLDNQKIAHKTHRHSPVFTVEEAQSVRADMPGGHSKNLFVRDKKKSHALIVAAEDRKIDLKNLAEQTGMGRLSFASPDRLMIHLGVTPGAVTPFSLLNAFKRSSPDGPAIQVVLDEGLLMHQLVYFHPLHNGATTAVSPKGLIKFIRACGFEPLVLPLQ